MPAEKIGDAYVEIAARMQGFQTQLAQAESRFSRFGARLRAIAHRTAVAVGSALASGMAVSLRAMMKQEEAEVMLAAALRAHGDAVGYLMPKLKALAAEMQRQTVYGDEEVLTLMAMLRNLGVLPAQMEAATKAAIGLREALGGTMDLRMAARYVALAMQGEFTMLRRYIPAVREAKDKTQMLAAFTEFVSRGFEVAKGRTESTAGAMAQMKNVVGDLAESIGFLTMAGLEGRQEFGKFRDTLASWADKLRAPKALYHVAAFIEQIRSGLAMAIVTLQTFFRLLTMRTGIRISDWLKHPLETIKRLPQVYRDMWEQAQEEVKNWQDTITDLGRQEEKNLEAIAKKYLGTRLKTREEMEQERKAAAALAEELQGGLEKGKGLAEAAKQAADAAERMRDAVRMVAAEELVRMAQEAVSQFVTGQEERQAQETLRKIAENTRKDAVASEKTVQQLSEFAVVH